LGYLRYGQKMSADPKILFGRRLAELRRRKGWSQETLSLESGIARSYLGGVERGQRNIALVNICKIADALEVQAGELFVFRSALKEEPSSRDTS
jgi:transcriptional regulator with XRE-family HTH domain